MEVANQYMTASPEGSDTTDILYMLAMAAPAAIKQYKNNPQIAQAIGITNDPIKTAINICNFIQKNIRYKADGFNEQRIVLPAQLLKIGVGDCKSFSLFFLAAAINAGIETGFRFASYAKNKRFTHVYNYIVVNNQKIVFDACVKNFKESPKYTNIKDMKVTYLAGTPSMITDMNSLISFANDDAIGKRSKAQRKAKRADKKADRKEKKAKKGGGIIKRAIKAGKKVALSPARGSFILLVDINFRGIARKLKLAREKDPERYKELWLKLGGDPNKLDKAVATGINKKPFLGSKKGINGIYTESDYIGVVAAATVTTAVTSAAALLAAFNKLFKSLGIKSEKGEGTDSEMEALTRDENGDIATIADGEDFTPADQDGSEAVRYNQRGEFDPSLPDLGKAGGGSIMSFIKTPVGMVTTAAVGYGLYKMFTSKKKK